MNIQDVLDRHNIDIRRGYIPCPVHDDRHPSCKVNEDYVYCFTCHWSADAVGLEAVLTDRTPADVLRTMDRPEGWRRSGKPKTKIPIHQQRVRLYSQWVADSQNTVNLILGRLPFYLIEAAAQQVWEIYDEVMSVWKDAAPFELEQTIAHSRSELDRWAAYWAEAGETEL